MALDKNSKIYVAGYHGLGALQLTNRTHNALRYQTNFREEARVLRV